MKPHLLQTASRMLPLSALALACALVACGGGGDDNRKPLPIDDASPHAYTLGYLNAHPDSVVQPEHLISVDIDPKAGREQAVDLWIRQPMTLSLGIAAGDAVITQVRLTDPSGHEVAARHPGEPAQSVTLGIGMHTLLFMPDSKADASQHHRVYLKLADTPSQATSRHLLGATDAPRQALGLVTSNSCTGCAFDNTDLTSETFNGQTLDRSTFTGVTLNNTAFEHVSCYYCLFDSVKTYYSAGFNYFTNSNLAASTFSPYPSQFPSFSYVLFGGSTLDQAVFSGKFDSCNFAGSPFDQAPTSLQYTDLRNAQFVESAFSEANLSYARASASTFSLPLTNVGQNIFFHHAHLDHMTPSNLFAGGALTNSYIVGTSFAGMDLSTTDLSVDNQVTLDSTTDLSQAKLSDGTHGVNLTNQSALFAAPFTAFAGNAATNTPGKDLRGANLSGVSLSRADLTLTKLDNANLLGTDLSYASLYGATLTGAQLGVDPNNQVLSPADLSNAYMPGVDFTDADLRSVNLTGAHMYTSPAGQVNLVRAKLDSAVFDGALLMGADFTSASVNASSFDDAALVNAKFDNATLTKVKFNNSYLQGVDFSNAATINGATLENAAVATDSGPWTYTESDNSPHTYSYVATQLGAIASDTGSTCPNGQTSPCTPDKLTPTQTPPYPIPAKCVLKPPRYDNCPIGAAAASKE